MSLLHLCQWLASTTGSIALHESHYMFVVVLTVHVLTLTVFVGTVVMIDLRLLGLTLSRVPASEVMARLLPWTMAGFLVMLASGVLLFYAAPVSRYQNLFFRLKMVSMGLAVINARVFHRTVIRTVADWDLAPTPPARVRLAAGVSLLLWAMVIAGGRMIPYQTYWFDCSNHLRPTIVTFLSGCTDDAPK